MVCLLNFTYISWRLVIALWNGVGVKPGEQSKHAVIFYSKQAPWHAVTSNYHDNSSVELLLPKWLSSKQFNIISDFFYPCVYGVHFTLLYLLLWKRTPIPDFSDPDTMRRVRLPCVSITFRHHTRKSCKAIIYGFVLIVGVIKTQGLWASNK